jgi:hypothetical protein
MSRQVFPTVDPAARQAITATNKNNVKSFFQPLYHYQNYPAAGISQLSFFGIPYTQAPGGLDDTNLLNAGILAQRSVEVTAIELMFFPGVTLAAASAAYVTDIQSVYASGRLEFRINNELILTDGPVGLFSSPTRLYTEGVQYAYPVGPLYRITNVVIPAQTSFAVDLKWNTPAPVSADARIGVRLQCVESRVS